MPKDSLEKIKNDIQNFKELAICHTCLNPVMGRGAPNAKIIFIGEAPGAEEDKQAKPFVGRSGKLLSQMLKTAKITESECYITNIVKYRPENNRDPSKQEKETCLPFLLREIKIINPMIIAPLGRHALEFFITNTQISEVRGQQITKKTSWNKKQIFFPLYHPAVGLYNPSKRELLQEDIHQLSKLLNTV